MRPFECEFESEVLEAALQGRWPDGVDAQLRAHVAGCETCRETSLVAVAIGESSQDLRSSAVLPSAGRIWWLAQLRARREAIQAAERPITLVHVIAFAFAAALLGACIGATSSWFQAALRWVQAQPVTGVIASHGLMLAGLAGAIILVPAIYFALKKA